MLLGFQALLGLWSCRVVRELTKLRAFRPMLRVILSEDFLTLANNLEVDFNFGIPILAVYIA